MLSEEITGAAVPPELSVAETAVMAAPPRGVMRNAAAWALPESSSTVTPIPVGGVGAVTGVPQTVADVQLMVVV